MITDRAGLAIVKPCDAARATYPDVLMWAEYPRPGRYASGDKRLAARDREECERWLEE